MKITDLSFVVVDVETTGGDSNTDRVIEVGAVKIKNGKIVDTFQSLINPNKRIPIFISWITGITNGMVSQAPCFFEIAEDFKAFLGNNVFVAHNAHFDFEFVRMEMARADLPRITNIPLCTIKLARRVFPGFTKYNLRDLSKNLGVVHERSHRALDDSLATAKILLLMFRRLEKLGIDNISDLERIYQQSPQECREYLTKLNSAPVYT